MQVMGRLLMVVEVARELTGEPGCWTDLYFLASFRGLLGEREGVGNGRTKSYRRVTSTIYTV